MAEASLLPLGQLHLHGHHDFLGDVVLKGEQIGEIAVVAFRPYVGAVDRVDELGNDADPITGSLYAAFEHVSDPLLLGHLLHRDGLALVGEGGVAGDDQKSPGPWRAWR